MNSGRTCPPCDGKCSEGQGRNCPAKPGLSSGLLTFLTIYVAIVLALIVAAGLIARHWA